MNEVTIFQPKGKNHIRYIRDKAMKLLKYRFKGDEAFVVDALKEAMRQHRMYLIAVHHANKQKQEKPNSIRDCWWKNQKTGLWEKLDQ